MPGTEIGTVATTIPTGLPLTLKELRSFEAATRGWPEVTTWDVQNSTGGPIIIAEMGSVQP